MPTSRRKKITRKKSNQEKNMKKVFLVASVFQLIIGISGVLAFVILTADGEIKLFSKWTMTFALALCFIIIGIKGIKDYKTI